MGYRLHYAQHYAPEWRGGYFNWGADKFAELFNDKFDESGWHSDNDDEFEIDRSDIENYLKELDALPAEDTHEYFSDYTNKEVADVFREILQSEDAVIRLEWF